MQMNRLTAKTLPLASVALVCLLVAQNSAGSAPDKVNPAIVAGGGTLSAALTPTSRSDDSWMDKHKALAKIAQSSEPDLVFFGDSITQGMNLDLMHKIFGANSCNFGIRGDRTQQLLWRLQHGELDFKNPGPKVFVVLIGTNNLLRWKDIPASTTGDTAAGVKADLAEIEKKFPESKILLLGILPRDEKPGTTTRRLVSETNMLLAKFADNKHIYFADIGASMLEPDAKISAKVMPDFLHPSSVEGYKRMFAAVKEKLDTIKRQGNDKK